MKLAQVSTLPERYASTEDAMEAEWHAIFATMDERDWPIGEVQGLEYDDAWDAMRAARDFAARHELISKYLSRYRFEVRCSRLFILKR